MLRRLKVGAKRAALRLYRTRRGQAAWRTIVGCAGKPFLGRALLRRFAVSDDGDSFVFPPIPLSPSSPGKHALVVLPFFGRDAASVVMESASAALRAEGYTVHALHYNVSENRPHSPFWNRSYFLERQSGSFGRTRAQPSALCAAGAATDFDRIDDWAGDELALFVAALGWEFDFEICVCNYVFLSRCLDYLPAATLRVLYTHDVFANRNARISAAGGSPTGWSFSTTEAEEAKGLRRADLVVAIQAEEGAYFEAAVGREHVYVLPHVPPRRFLPPRPSSSPFALGYVASAHYPNVDAIRSFIAIFDFSGGAVLRIAGNVSIGLAELELPPQVELLGAIDDLARFYESCDLFINPDMLKSGLKIKCVEALSFGKPLICTAAASAGIGMTADYHTATTIAEVARHAARAAQDSEFRNNVMTESRRAFDSFFRRYATQNLVEKCAEFVKTKRPEVDVASRTRTRASGE
jgi:glycosyltransferase involved in cell wall biosynthesis